MSDNGDADRYCDKSLQELKEILRQRKLKVTGKKKDLVERLQFDDINSSKQEPVPEFHMTLPNALSYKDIHSDHLQNFPVITKQRLLDFFNSCAKSFDEKIEMLYEQRYLRYLRFTKEGDQLTFVTGDVWAEMKKSTSYKVDLSLDKNGVVRETQCECAVGQGPSAHCKHVGCVLFALTKYCSSGCVLTEVTCIQVLQTFHKPKQHKGSPLKAKSLSSARGNTKSILYDPRPIHRRNKEKIEEILRCTVLNWQGKSKWPVLQKYECANVKALAADHDYLEMTWEEHFLKEQKVSHITPQEVAEIEILSRKQHSSTTWSVERVKRLTAYNFGQLCKLTEKSDIVQLIKTITQPNALQSKALAHGRKYESVAVEHFEKMSECKTQECGLFVSQSHPMLAATPDRILDDNTLLEVKCPYTARHMCISERNIPYLTTLDDKLTLKKNHNYYYQIQGQLFCTNRKLCKFIVYTHKDMKIIDVQYDEEFTKEMVKKLLCFYDAHFKSAILKQFMYKG